MRLPVDTLSPEPSALLMLPTRQASMPPSVISLMMELEGTREELWQRGRGGGSGKRCSILCACKALRNAGLAQACRQACRQEDLHSWRTGSRSIWSCLQPALTSPLDRSTGNCPSPCLSASASLPSAIAPQVNKSNSWSPEPKPGTGLG